MALTDVWEKVSEIITKTQIKPSTNKLLIKHDA